ncbi:MAG: DUF2059 domain-containing protein [Candidatus Acidiferrales bacterium]
MKSRMALLVSVTAAALLAASPVLAQSAGAGTASAPPPAAPAQASAPAAKLDPAKEAAIRHLMDITETSKMGENLQVYVTERVHKVAGDAIAPDRLQKFMDTFTAKFNASAPASAVTDALVPIYAKNFSMEDIQELIRFYESPLGQRVVKTMPKVSAESQETGIEIDQNAALVVLRGMSAEYAEIRPMLPAEEPPPAAAPAPGAAPAPSIAPAPKAATAPKAPVAPGTPAAPKLAPQD